MQSQSDSRRRSRTLHRAAPSHHPIYRLIIVSTPGQSTASHAPVWPRRCPQLRLVGMCHTCTAALQHITCEGANQTTNLWLALRLRLSHKCTSRLKLRSLVRQLCEPTDAKFHLRWMIQPRTPPSEVAVKVDLARVLAII